MKLSNGLEIELSPTDIFGLKFLPQIIGRGPYANNKDFLGDRRSIPNEVSSNNFNLAAELTIKFSPKSIVEIGVDRNNPKAFTKAWLNNKTKYSTYLGIDVEDKSYLNDKDNSIFTIRENSHNQNKIRSYMREIGIQEISILFIDGWHSVNTVINDFRYADLLSKDGIVVFHDTNYHPGPLAILECIDTNLFKIEKRFENEDDWGMAVAYKKYD